MEGNFKNVKKLIYEGEEYTKNICWKYPSMEKAFIFCNKTLT